MKLNKIKQSLNAVFLIFSLILIFKPPSYSAENKIEISIIQIEAKTILGVHDSVLDMKNISEVIGKAYQELGDFIQKYNVKCIGVPMTVTISMAGSKWDFIAAFPIEKMNIKTEGRVQLASVKGGKVVKGVMTGPYDKSRPCYDSIVKFIRENKLTISGFSWEEYISDPAKTKPEDLITNIYFPVE